MKNEEIKIEKMVLNIDGENVSLTMEQAKKLKGILDELFGKEIIKEIIHDHHYHDWWYRPYYLSSGGSLQIPNQIYCSSNTLSVNV